MAYYRNREAKRALRYRLNRRSREVIDAIKMHMGSTVGCLVDVGCADNLMVERICRDLAVRSNVGLDYDRGLLGLSNSKRGMAQADAHALPLKENSVDVLVATAMIEHVRYPRLAVSEFERVLRAGGICVITTPNPLMATAARVFGIHDDAELQSFTLPQLIELSELGRLRVSGAKRFLLSPFGVPLEEQIEGILRALRIDFVLANQIVVAKKPADANKGSHRRGL